MFQSDYNKTEKVLVCVFDGHIDTNICLSYSPELQSMIDKIRAFEPSGEFDIIFDLKEVSYIASSFIRICVNAAKQVPQGRFQIVNSNPYIKNTFKVVGLDELLKMN
jgi:anti-anti-sigma factor